MIEEKFKVEGSPCQGYRFLPDEGAPRAVMHVVHGLAEHAARYRRLAEAMVADGWAVYAHDHRGHGETVEKVEDLGRLKEPGTWSRLADDLARFVEHEGRAHAGLPRVLLGHSMGAMVTQAYLSQPGVAPLAAVVLSGSVGNPPPIARIGALVAQVEIWRQGRQGRSPILRALTFGAYNRDFAPTRTQSDWLSKDPAEVDKYVQDPKCGFDVSNQFMKDFTQGLQALFAPDRIASIPKGVPIYAFAGDLDPVGRKGQAIKEMVDIMKKAGVSIEYKLYPSGRHEMLNEINREEVVQDLKAWLGARGLPPAAA